MAYFRDGLQDVDAHTRRGTESSAGRDLGGHEQVRTEMPVHVLESREHNAQSGSIHRSLSNIVPRLGDLQVRGNDLDLAVGSPRNQGVEVLIDGSAKDSSPELRKVRRQVCTSAAKADSHWTSDN